MSFFFDVSDKEGKNTPRSVPEPEPFMLRSKKRLKLLATTVLGDAGRFHSLLLVIGCAHTIKKEMTRLGKAHRIQEGSRSCKGPGFCEQTSSLEMPLQSGWSSCSAVSHFHSHTETGSSFCFPATNFAFLEDGEVVSGYCALSTDLFFTQCGSCFQ